MQSEHFFGKWRSISVLLRKISRTMKESESTFAECLQTGFCRPAIRVKSPPKNVRKLLSWRRGGDSNPRYRFKPVRRFSKPLLSTTQPPLRVCRARCRRGNGRCHHIILRFSPFMLRPLKGGRLTVLGIPPYSTRQPLPGGRGSVPGATRLHVVTEPLPPGSGCRSPILPKTVKRPGKALNPKSSQRCSSSPFS